ncbi:hypothetical protein CVT24_000653 [Panaeolus cyanescens]|uniref:Uncharacterized protein n=1 Tax=Panaeolus cyanescens TaxID=181874 RepID=A0A409YY02_9AGAR|nr:hypothetical protein CVT24_000653 [Panaeolus cyanescens]
MTTASPIPITLIPTPSTTNTLNPHERSRLLKSTRKLEAVLGTTPLVFIEDVAPLSDTTPRRTKRQGGIYHSPTSSISSIEDVDRIPRRKDRDDGDYVFISPNTRSAPYQHQYVPPPSQSQLSVINDNSRAPSASSFYDISPSSSRSASPMPVKKQRRSPDLALALPLSSKKSKAQQPLAQPLVLRLRSVPSKYPVVPLSPANSTFTVDTVRTTQTTMTVDTITPTKAGLTDREKRKKMAKLARTLGENVPPELVFGRSTAARRRSSVCGAWGAAARVDTGSEVKRVREEPAKPSPASSTNSSPASIPLSITVSREVQMDKTPKRESFLIMNDAEDVPIIAKKELGISGKGKRKHRPRSLTLGSASAFAAFPATTNSGSASKAASSSTSKATTASRSTSNMLNVRGTTSLDVQRPPRPSSDENRPLPALPLRVRMQEDVAFARVGDEVGVRKEVGGLDVDVEDWRRKEREWSGEWNLKDMEGVTKALRELRGR